MTDPRRESGRSPRTTGGSGEDVETPERPPEPEPQGDGDPRERDESQGSAPARPDRDGDER